MSAAVSVNANFTGLNLLGLLQWLAGLAVGGWEATLLITAVGTPGHPPAILLGGWAVVQEGFPESLLLLHSPVPILFSSHYTFN